MPEIHINPDQNLTGHIEASEMQNLTGRIGVGYVYPTLETLEVTPTTERQLIYPEKYGFSEVEVDAVDNTIDEDIKAENIKKDVEILGVVGTYDGLIGQEKTVTPTTNEQVITPDEGYTGLTKVKINPVTSEIDEDIVANNIKKGAEILGVVGNVEEVNAQRKNVTPTTSQQTITPDSDYNALSEVVVGAVDSSIDNNIIPRNIREGVEILGVGGSIVEKIGQDKNVTPTTNNQIVEPDSGYNALNRVYVDAIQTETKNVYPSEISQRILPTTGKFIDEINVAPMRLQSIVDTIAQNGTKIYNSDAEHDAIGNVYLDVDVQPNLESKTTTPSTSQQTIIPSSGYDGLSQVIVEAVDNTIDENIIASNIKKDVEILRNNWNIRRNRRFEHRINSTRYSISKSRIKNSTNDTSTRKQKSIRFAGSNK